MSDETVKDYETKLVALKFTMDNLSFFIGKRRHDILEARVDINKAETQRLDNKNQQEHIEKLLAKLNTSAEA
ncbi:hypothetical protein LCGC14_1303650 [marine sediment metagenome]|uniref:Uncharacterized protein n=1 Tax=marine sediment metagenome TaxID=412755 RepID=A0A0F9L9G5_9ZZZZ